MPTVNSQTDRRCRYGMCLIILDMPGRKNCSRFPKMLPKLVVLCSLPSEDEISHAGYIASKSSQPDTAYCCEVCNVEYGDEVCQAFHAPSLLCIYYNYQMILQYLLSINDIITCHQYGKVVSANLWP